MAQELLTFWMGVLNIKKNDRLFEANVTLIKNPCEECFSGYSH
jgi:hypothetical protein